MTADPMTTEDLDMIRDAVERRADHYSDRKRVLAEVYRLRAENARLAAQDRASGPETSQGHPSEGTGAPGAHARSESGDRRWSLTINDDGTITAAFDANSHTAVPTRERDIADAARPAHYREAAAFLRAIADETGVRNAADILDNAAADLNTESETTR